MDTIPNMMQRQIKLPINKDIISGLDVVFGEPSNKTIESSVESSVDSTVDSNDGNDSWTDLSDDNDLETYSDGAVEFIDETTKMSAEKSLLQKKSVLLFVYKYERNFIKNKNHDKLMKKLMKINEMNTGLIKEIFIKSIRKYKIHNVYMHIINHKLLKNSDEIPHCNLISEINLSKDLNLSKDFNLSEYMYSLLIFFIEKNFCSDTRILKIYKHNIEFTDEKINDLITEIILRCDTKCIFFFGPQILHYLSTISNSNFAKLTVKPCSHELTIENLIVSIRKYGKLIDNDKLYNLISKTCDIFAGFRNIIIEEMIIHAGAGYDIRHICAIFLEHSTDLQEIGVLLCKIDIKISIELLGHINNPILTDSDMYLLKLLFIGKNNNNYISKKILVDHIELYNFECDIVFIIMCMTGDQQMIEFISQKNSRYIYKDGKCYIKPKTQIKNARSG